MGSEPVRGGSVDVGRLCILEVPAIYLKYPLSLRNVEDLLAERGFHICHETVRVRRNRFGPIFAEEIRKKRVDRVCGHTHWRWHLDQIYVKINGEMHSLRRAVDHKETSAGIPREQDGRQGKLALDRQHRFKSRCADHP